ncbi:MAG: BNR repeat-containing protein [Thermoguttaceae bacterium]|nr:BNR repeat-containing protein [Thermoguttaceae bacterium]
MQATPRERAICKRPKALSRMGSAFCALTLLATALAAFWVGIPSGTGPEVFAADQPDKQGDQGASVNRMAIAQDAAELSFGPLARGIELGGIGGAYFLADPGELVIEVSKRDLNRISRTTELWAILAGPDRRVLAEAKIPDDGLPLGTLGPRRTAILRAPVPRKGVYALNITVSQDRYGEAMYWSFRTNCRQYVIETSRGHRDAPHEEPIVLFCPEQAAEVWFRPTPLEFRIEVLTDSSTPPQLLDQEGRVLPTFVRADNAGWQADVPADSNRQGLWKLVLPPGVSTVHVDGLTRWRSGDPYRDLCYWAPEAEAYIPFVDYRWLLVPYRRVVYLEDKPEKQVSFQLHNNGRQPMDVTLSVEYPSEPVPVRLGTSQVRIAPGATESVELACGLAAGQSAGVFHIRVTPTHDASWSTYSTVEVSTGLPPAAKPFEPPLVLKPYQHENEQLGLLPDYPTEGELYFDLRNYPYVVARGDLWTLADGSWQPIQLNQKCVWAGEGTRARWVRPLTPKVAFDNAGAIYLVCRVDDKDALIFSADGGSHWQAVAFPQPNVQAAYDLEVFTGHNVPQGPPAILRFVYLGRDPKLFWRYMHRLELYVPEKTAGTITLGEPIVLSEECLGLSSHSGSPNCVLSCGDMVHAIWAQATDPNVKLPGTPAYVNTWNRKSRTLGKPVLVGYGAPPNDIHNTPALTIDSKGFLHTLGGTHGTPFPYAQSLVPNDTQKGFTEPIYISKGEQTYIGFVCGPDDTLYTAFRLWQRAKDPFPNSHFATLALQRKKPDQPWQEPVVLIIPPFSEYSVYYHRLTIDRKGRLFLSYDYWSTHWFYRIDHFGRRRVSMFSADGGRTWKFLTTADLLPSGK